MSHYGEGRRGLTIRQFSAAHEIGGGEEQARPRRGLSLRVNFAWTFVGNVVYAACQWGMLVVLAKMGNATMVGQFALALAIVAPVMMLSKMNLKGVQATDARRDFQFGDYLALRLVTTALSMVIIAGIVVATGYGGVTAAVVLIVGLAKAFETISDIIYGLVQQRERMDRIAISMMIKGGVSLLALGAGVYLTGSIVWGVVGLAASWALILATYDVRSAALVQDPGALVASLARLFRSEGLLHPRWDLRTLVRLGWLALPLGLVMMLNSLGTSVPRYFIQHYLGSRDLGIFAAMAYLMVAGNTVIAALSDSASPRLSQYYAAGNRAAYRQLLFRLLLLGGGLGLAGVLVSAVAGKLVLTLLYRPEYAQHADVLVWLAITATGTFLIWFLGCGMTSARYFRVQTPLNAGALLITALACPLLIPGHGLLGATWALLLGTLTQLVAMSAVLALIVRRQPRSPLPEAQILQPETAYANGSD